MAAVWRADEIHPCFCAIGIEVPSQGRKRPMLSPVGCESRRSARPTRASCSVAAKRVRGVFERRASGWSWRRIALWFMEQGGSDRSTGQGMRLMVANTTYLGHARHGDHQKENAHEPIIDAALFHKAKTRRARSEAHRSQQPVPTRTRRVPRCFRERVSDRFPVPLAHRGERERVKRDPTTQPGRPLRRGSAGQGKTDACAQNVHTTRLGRGRGHGELTPCSSASGGRSRRGWRPSRRLDR